MRFFCPCFYHVAELFLHCLHAKRSRAYEQRLTGAREEEHQAPPVAMFRNNLVG